MTMAARLDLLVVGFLVGFVLGLLWSVPAYRRGYHRGVADGYAQYANELHAEYVDDEMQTYGDAYAFLQSQRD